MPYIIPNCVLWGYIESYWVELIEPFLQRSRNKVSPGDDDLGTIGDQMQTFPAFSNPILNFNFYVY